MTHLSLMRVRQIEVTAAHIHHLERLELEAMDDEDRTGGEHMALFNQILPSFAIASNVTPQSASPPAFGQPPRRATLKIGNCWGALVTLLASDGLRKFLPGNIILAGAGSDTMARAIALLFKTHGLHIMSLTILRRARDYGNSEFYRNISTFAILEALQNSATFLSAKSLTGISIAIVYGLCDVDIIWRDMQESLGVWRYLDSILSHGSFPQLARISLVFDFSESRGLSLEFMARLEGKINDGFDPMMPNFGSQGRGIVEVAVVKPSRYE
ncbi:hypothetical protein NMY22_g13052 [Coprinellus aureogranulatus]|nr:hypothetical protein NMY22_g13052 [Coprinellus aureogranulatus]